MDHEVALPGLPMPMRWEVPPANWAADADGALSVTAAARTDLFADPSGDAPVTNAPRLLGPVAGDFQLSARVRVDFAATYDAGVLILRRNERAWAKLCFEWSPQAEATVVSVVTRGLSDDANAFIVPAGEVWLRVSAVGPAFAFHASTDGGGWRLVRYFALEDDEVAVGFSAQSPAGEGCTARFDGIAFTTERLANLRDGT